MTGLDPYRLLGCALCSLSALLVLLVLTGAAWLAKHAWISAGASVAQEGVR